MCSSRGWVCEWRRRRRGGEDYWKTSALCVNENKKKKTTNKRLSSVALKRKWVSPTRKIGPRGSLRAKGHRVVAVVMMRMRMVVVVVVVDVCGGH